jgi:predicted RNase H-like HicB family nuclease
MTGVPRRGGPIHVDLTHCNRHMTGLERIAVELFSAEALAPLAVTPVTASGTLGMILGQSVGLPARLLRDPRAIAICPGFPPQWLVALFGARVLPYVHDLFLITRRQDLNIRARLYMAPAFAFAVRHLPRFLVNSATTAAALRAVARPDAEILLYRPVVRNVFALAVGDRAARPAPSGALRLIALGTLEPRKNIGATIALLATLRTGPFPGATLDLVGRPGWGVDTDALARMPGITVHGYQPQAAIKALVEAADIFITTAHDEGLGLPALEVSFAGLDAVVSDIPVFREALGDAALFIDPADPGAAAAALAARVQARDWRGIATARTLANLGRWNAAAAADRAAVVGLIARLSGQALPPDP